MRGAGCGRGGRAGAMTAAARGLRGLEVRIRARGLCLGGLRHRLLGSAGATTMTTPWTSIVSPPVMPARMAVPMPGRLKMTSMTTAPPMR